LLLAITRASASGPVAIVAAPPRRGQARAAGDTTIRESRPQLRRSGMRTIVKWLSVAAVMWLAPPAWADPAALAIVEKAIKAHGGAAALKKTQVCARSDTGALVRPDK